MILMDVYDHGRWLATFFLLLKVRRVFHLAAGEEATGWVDSVKQKGEHAGAAGGASQSSAGE